MMSLKHTSIPPSYEVAALQLQLKQKQSNRIKIREIKPTTQHTSKKLPKLTFVFDTESTIKEENDGTQLHTLRFGYGLFTRYYANGRVYESDYDYFEDGEQLYNILARYARQGSKLYAFAHNLGFDWSITGIHPILLEHGWGTNTIADRKGTTVITYTRDKHKIIFIDTINYFKTSLRDLAKDFGLEKGSVDFRHSDEKTLKDYCKNDVYILNEVMIKWRNLLLKENYGAFKPTLASQALAILKQKYLHEPIKTGQGAAQKGLERRAYYGGRTEANFVGYYRGKIWNLDLNSAYPSVMRDNKYPVEYERECRNPTVEQIRELDDKHCCFAEVEIDCDQAFYPVRRDDRLLFPVGRFVTWLCEPELVVALENGHIHKLRRLFVYKARPIFTGFVDDLYRKRRAAIQNNNSALALCYKLLLNSLYGKFGEHRQEWEAIRTNNGHEDGIEYVGNLDKRIIYKTIHFGGLQYEYIQKEGATHSFPLISAFVTSYLRVKILRAMSRAGCRNWIYCDSDSLFVTDAGKRNMAGLIDPVRLGAWKIEKIGIDMDIRGLKDYCFANKDKIKGIPSDAVQLSDNEYKMNKWQTMHQTICEGKHGSITVSPLIKKLDRVYHKGTVGADGWVIPIVLTELPSPP